MSEKKTFKIYTLGCKANQYDSDVLKRRLLALNFEETMKNADLVIINTCAVTKTAIRKDNYIINKAKKENSKAITVIKGCLPEVYKNDFKSNDKELIFGVGKDNNLIEEVLEKFKKKLIREKEGDISFKTDKSRYFIKIQDGCEQFCSYCVIPYARGNLYSRPKKEILIEIKKAIKSGYEEIVLTGIHLGLYGKEKNSKCNCKNLTALLEELIKIDKLKRIRLSSIEINDVSDELIDLIFKNNKICKHLHISLQSGCNKILKAMNRPYTKEYFEKRVKKIKKMIPEIAMSTDVITGFPGETDKDFKETYDFIKKINFSRLHVFPFSPHQITPASKFPNQINLKTKQKRSKILRDLGKKLTKTYFKKFADKEIYILIENIKGDKFYGKSEYYFDVIFTKKNIVEKPKTTKLIGKLVKIRLNY